MIKNVLIGQYIHRKSVFHSLDPRTKLICIFLFMISVFFVHNILSHITVTLIVLLCLNLSKIPFTVFINGLKPIFIILMFTFLFHIFLTKEGDVIYSLGYITIYKEGLIAGIRIVIRIILLVLITSLLTLTTKPLDLAQGLEKLLKPLEFTRLPIGQFSLMISIALRFIPTLLNETNKIIEAQKARGATFESKNIVKKLYFFLPIIVPLLIMSVQRADNLSFAIDARAYGDGRGRTKFKELNYRLPDYIAFTIFILLFLIVVIMI
ncbi:energy-coupling factor transporter transmembrane component T family protein [Virgibacillus dokdonensis]|uniref:Energy-coupling factor transporter transmembrane protein EcfT n=1 Tax=Virgibacillus dokdonensis TaxID=302167 RepID=A0A2K9IXD9_9BACI|nr:energy-coupling factor transporter transmembrane component T [Virgibacillus dokdonensis]AUJ24125.1 Energy-coupling factor transporter transmembrane protein EcfT [Virgibacillus dokdonensis]